MNTGFSPAGDMKGDIRAIASTDGQPPKHEADWPTTLPPMLVVKKTCIHKDTSIALLPWPFRYNKTQRSELMLAPVDYRITIITCIQR